jgi:hypothetical protein
MSKGSKRPNEVYGDSKRVAEEKLRENLQRWREKFFAASPKSSRTGLQPDGRGPEKTTTHSMAALKDWMLTSPPMPQLSLDALASLDSHVLEFIYSDLQALTQLLQSPEWRSPSGMEALSFFDGEKDMHLERVRRDYWLSETKDFSNSGKVERDVTDYFWDRIIIKVSKFVAECRPNLLAEWGLRAEAAKRPKRPSVAKAGDRVKAVEESIRSGKKGPKHAQFLDFCGAKIPSKWIDEGCPTTNVKAYSIPKFAKRLQDEKYRVARDLKEGKNSPTRHNE